ncbi:Uu.00g062900.m01.CDS01 [Anthostomella pinea]|uniref:EKC/KEOPS complex subunit GON7 n=1 Tax=Anthostomella pinea TaxID=933095 RepID=A0AAI8VU40_9PEZI|nr:Uu.00g062900.m01.CDS01 [Anthostomella pinea]
MSPSTSAPQPAHLKATYTSPTNAPLEVSTPLATFPTDPASVDQKTAYLGALRKATTALQECINIELTARMEEDNARDADSTATGKTGKTTDVDDVAEEDNYGEEVQGGDD